MPSSNPLVDVFGRSPVKPIQEHMEKAFGCAMLLPAMIQAAQKSDWTKAADMQKQIARAEQEADKLKNSLRTHVPKRLFMPVSRSDLIQLVTAQDEIANCTKDIAGLILGRKIQFPKKLSKQYLEFLNASLAAAGRALAAIQELDEVFEVGFGRREIRSVDSLIKQISKAEKKADKLEVKLRAELFQIEADLPPVEVMFLYRLLELVGDVADHAESTGNRLQILIS